jgi:mannose-6-phosphate isomerase-like protein (cupin superfamily)
MADRPVVLTAATDLATETTSQRFHGRDHGVGVSGQVVVVPAGATHAFRNTGATTLEMVSIHPVAEMVTEWVDAGSPSPGVR